jgi:hypothetical protein
VRVADRALDGVWVAVGGTRQLIIKCCQGLAGDLLVHGRGVGSEQGASGWRPVRMGRLRLIGSLICTVYRRDVVDGADPNPCQPR